MRVVIPQIAWHARDPVLTLDFDPKGKSDEGYYRLASGGADRLLLIWHLSNPTHLKPDIICVSELTRHQKGINVVRFSPCGNYIASGDDDSYVFIWKNESVSEKEEVWNVEKIFRRHVEDVSDLCWSPDSNYLVSGSVDNTAVLWDVKKGTPIHFWSEREHTGFVQGVVYDPLGEFSATMCIDRNLRFFSNKNGKLITKTLKYPPAWTGIEEEEPAKENNPDALTSSQPDSSEPGKEEEKDSIQPILLKEGDDSPVKADKENVPVKEDEDIEIMEVDPPVLSPQAPVENEKEPSVDEAGAAAAPESAIEQPVEALEDNDNDSRESKPLSEINGDDQLPQFKLPPKRPATTLNRIFHDDSLKTFCRRLSFSPRGELLIVPGGLLPPVEKDEKKESSSRQSTPPPVDSEDSLDKKDDLSENMANSPEKKEELSETTGKSPQKDVSEKMEKTPSPEKKKELPQKTEKSPSPEKKEEILEKMEEEAEEASKEEDLENKEEDSSNDSSDIPENNEEQSEKMEEADVAEAPEEAGADKNEEEDKDKEKAPEKARYDPEQNNAAIIFCRNSWSNPCAIIPTGKSYSIAARFNPLYFERERETYEYDPEFQNSTKRNERIISAVGKLRPAEKEHPVLLDMPYRLVYAVATNDSLLIGDTSSMEPLACLKNIHCTRMTDIAWSPDGLVLIAASTDGFCSILTFEEGELGAHLKLEGDQEFPALTPNCFPIAPPEPKPAKKPKEPKEPKEPIPVDQDNAEKEKKEKPEKEKKEKKEKPEKEKKEKKEKDKQPGTPPVENKEEKKKGPGLLQKMFTSMMNSPNTTLKSPSTPTGAATGIRPVEETGTPSSPATSTASPQNAEGTPSEEPANTTPKRTFMDGWVQKTPKSGDGKTPRRIQLTTITKANKVKLDERDAETSSPSTNQTQNTNETSTVSTVPMVSKQGRRVCFVTLGKDGEPCEPSTKRRAVEDVIADKPVPESKVSTPSSSQESNVTPTSSQETPSQALNSPVVALNGGSVNGGEAAAKPLAVSASSPAAVTVQKKTPRRIVPKLISTPLNSEKKENNLESLNPVERVIAKISSESKANEEENSPENATSGKESVAKLSLSNANEVQ